MSVAVYVRTVASEAPGGVKETTHYPALKELLNAAGDELNPKVRVIIHPTGGREAGIPDGVFWTANLLPREGQPGLDLYGTEHRVPDRGALEVKGFAQSLNALAEDPQVQKYLLKYRQVLITNLRQFAVVQLRDGKPVIIDDYTLAESKEAFCALGDGDLRAHERPLREFLRRALTAQTAMAQPGEVAFHLASHAREAKARLDLFDDFLELNGLKQTLESALGITFAGERGDAFFRAELVQTLFYGVFSAWVLWHEEDPQRTDAFDYRTTSHYLRVPVIDRLYNAAASRNVLQQTKLMHTLRNAADVLNRVDRTAFFAAFDQGLAVQYFYEPFLAAFDPDLRKQLGVWYTPPEIVRGMVAKCDRLLMDELGEPDGLAGDNVLLLDPCCGTGAYVVEALRVAAERWKARGEPYADRLRRAATSRMFGFELLTGPFVVAHLQVAFLLAKHGVHLHDDERVGIFLTNALTGWEPIAEERRILDPLALFAESDRAHAVKRDERILVVIGNPPYSGYAGISTMSEERSLSERYRPSDGSPGQGLNDLYVRFFAMAERRIERTEQGIVCLISNYSWLEGLSHVRMREVMSRSFDRIWIDNMHGDRRISERTPTGETSETVFAIRGQSDGIKPGVAISTLIRLPHTAIREAEVFHRDFHQARAADRRAAYLQNLGNYERVFPNRALGLPFRPREVSASYLSWPRLIEIFPTSYPGVKTSRDDLLVDIDRERLEARMRRYFDPGVTDAAIDREVPGTMQSSARYDAVGIRRTLSCRGIDALGFRKYFYRPFDCRWIYWERETKLLDEKRVELAQNVAQDNLWIEARQKEAQPEWQRGTVTQSLPDNLGNGLSNWFPLKICPDDSVDAQLRLDGTDGADDRILWNLSQAAWENLDRHGLAERPDTLFFHALAVMHAPGYAAENVDALRQDWPRVPHQPADGNGTREWLLSGGELGKRVAALLDIETPVTGIDTGDPDPRFTGVARFEWTGTQPYQEGTNDLAMDGGWGYRGQSGVTMPGNGRVVELGDGTLDVIFHDRARWTGVPRAVWEYHLGGYQVLKKWLSYREADVLGRPMRLDEIRTFTAIARRIAALLALGPELDAHYRRATG